MKKYWKETAALILQTALFYLFPLCAGPTDGIGMVIVILSGTFALGALLGGLSGSALRFAFPPIAALLFLPTVPIYYNFSAQVHALWYLIVAYTGVGLGACFRWAILKLAKF